MCGVRLFLRFAYCLPQNNHYMTVLYIFLNVYLFLREREKCERGRAERESETQNQKQAPGSELLAQSPMWGLNSRAVRS